MRPRNPRRLRPGQVSQLVVAAADGSTLAVVYDTHDLIEAPNWTPDGQWLIYNADGRLFRISPDGRIGPQRIDTAPIEDLNNDHLVSPCGRLLFMSANDGHIYRVPSEGGIPVKVTGGKPDNGKFRHYLHGLSPDGGTLAYVGLDVLDGRTVTTIRTLSLHDGTERVLTDGSVPVDGPDYAPDGSWIYYNSEQARQSPGHAQIFRMRPDGAAQRQLTHDDRVNWFPHPSPDGRMVVYLSYPPGTRGHPPDHAVILRLMTPDGDDMRDLDRFNGGQGTINVSSWSPDSTRLAYVRYPFV